MLKPPLIGGKMPSSYGQPAEKSETILNILVTIPDTSRYSDTF
jgi:hypothetical protein